VDGVTYDVKIVLSYAVAIYDAYPGTYTFTTPSEANVAIDAINSALNDAGATAVNALGESFNYEKYRIGYEGVIINSNEFCEFMAGDYDTSWENLGGENTLYNDATSNWTWAVFTAK
jgi:hypothetical protein